MYLADALSSLSVGHTQKTLINPTARILSCIELAEHLPISAEANSGADHNLQVLQETILTGWPSNKSQIPSEIKPYLKCHDKLTMQDGILFKGSRIVIPAAIRKEMIHKVHEGPLGVESCLQRAREVFY